MVNDEFEHFLDGANVVKLKDVSLKIGSGSTPRGGESAYIDEREVFAFVRSQNVYDFRFNTDGIRFITDGDAHKLKGVHLQRDDILLNITGDGLTFARCCLVPESILPAAVNQHVCIIRVDKEKCLPSYLLAFLCLPETKKYIENFNAGGSRRAITKGHIESFEIPLLPMTIQKVISRNAEDILCKQKLNNQINQTLEQMAQTLFKSWFVDFDPVKAKMNGEQPKGMNAATASLFPEKLVESELGLIPEGWEASKLEDLVDIASSKRVFAKEYLKEGVPFYRGKEITELSKGNSVTPEIYISEERYQELKDKAGAPKKGDILITSVGTIGNTYLVDLEDKFYFKDGNLTWVRGYKGEEIPYFLMEWFNSAVGKCAVENIKIGSTQQAITIKSLNGIKLVSPPNDIHMKFTQLIEPLYRKHRANIKQSKALANLRDTLLPKLLSGEIDLENVQVKEVKAIVE
ncbi:restriction endonuclease subunit S [Vibrio splendidus]|uniref:restriction endonuclease subunit S n=1 Tax=Vibrio splendidus TaxID=29497 RepID=UPI000D3B4202|nr:restriction endonuclease subunit S [Vibrio splendidus]PTP94443.1 hypothetical protein CWO02_05300 [Vibrio splendidus]